MILKTNYPIGEIPHAEHPMPQAERESWLCLNGKWSFYKICASGEESVPFSILVPFSPETPNSGVPRGFSLGAGDKIVYTHTFDVSRALLLGRTVLHFGAVDSFCAVTLNGRELGFHKGGFTAFSFDVSDVIREGKNDLCVVCTDDATRNGDARGKQSDRRGGIWYTPQSGIWQTVWLESMPATYIRNLKITPDAASRSVRIESDSMGEMQSVAIYDGDVEILRAEYTDAVTLTHAFELWSPERPKLYDLIITNASGDRLRSYFGVRSFGQTHDKNGIARLTLNGKPYFFNGVLDQGYWSDGYLTYPSDKAAYDELKMLHDMGFNTVRKHIKIEPMRWYYHCDRLGLVVWQDFVNGGGEYSFAHVAALPFLGFHHKDSDYRYFAREDAEARADFLREADETVAQLYNCVSIGLWCPFNEGWGQFDSAEVTERVRRLDTTRIIDSVSGWHDQGVGKTDLCSLHTYYTPLRVPRDPRPVVLSEFGGYSMKVEGHVFDPKREFGYKKFRSTDDLLAALTVLYLKKLLPLISRGLCGCIYTQVSDVEEEINGLVTYDRKVRKVPVEAMRLINQAIRNEADKVT